MPINAPLPLHGSAVRRQSARPAASIDELDQLSETARLMPHRADAHHALAMALARRALFAPALDAFEAALRCDPTQADSIQGAGQVLRHQGDECAAADFMTRHLVTAFQTLRTDTPRLLEMHHRAPGLLAECLPGPKIDPVMQQLAQPLHEEADHALHAGRADVSIALLESVKNFNPAHLGTSDTLGDAYLFTGQPHLALLAFDNCSNRESSDVAKAAHARLCAKKILLMGYARYAIPMFRTAWLLSVRASLPAAEQANMLVGLGIAEYSAGDLREAFRSFDLSIETHPLGNALRYRGLIHLGTGEEQAAWDDFEEAFLANVEQGEQVSNYQFSNLLMQCLPHAHQPIYWSAESALSLGLLDTARQLFIRLVDSLEDTRLPIIGLQRIRMAEGDCETAQIVLNHMAKEHPDYLPAHFWAARCSMLNALNKPDQHQASVLFDQALEHVRDALRLNPGDLDAKTVAADALLCKGQHARALQGYAEIEKGLSEPQKSGLFGQRIGLHKIMLADWLDEPREALDSLVNTVSPHTLPARDFYLQRAVISLALDQHNAAQAPQGETPQA